jgi:hypothetical protein
LFPVGAGEVLPGDDFGFFYSLEQRRWRSMRKSKWSEEELLGKPKVINFELLDETTSLRHSSLIYTFFVTFYLSYCQT